jgi:sugar lactone lactonase YvrE
LSGYSPKLVLDIRAELGEHPVWRVEDQRLYWIDIEKSTINRFDPATGGNVTWALPAAPGCFAFKDDGGALIAARDGIYDFDFASGAATLRRAAPFDPAVFRFNDGKTDRQGRLWVGTMRVDFDIVATSQNAYWRLDGERLDEVITKAGVTNGTAFSPDGRTFYRGQTETRQIHAYDYDPATGQPSNPRVFTVIPEEFGLPDGATVDVDGGYWVALATPPQGGKCGVARFTPDGRLDIFFETPAPITTMVAFGGPQMSTLYITTGRLQAIMPYETPAQAGGIYVVETSFRGVPEAPFRAA